MRRKFFFFLLFALFVLPCATFADGQGGIQFIQGQPHRSLQFNQYFELMTATQGPCTLSIQADIFNADKALDYMNMVHDDLQQISVASNISIDAFSPFTLFVVKSTPNGIEKHTNQIYCSPEDIKSESHLPALVAAVLDVEEYWKAYGLSAFIQNHQPDDELLRTFYQEATDLDSVSLFIAYFIEPFASPKEVHLAKQTATALTRYIIDTHGASAFLNDDCIAYKQKWLNSIGVAKQYEDPLLADLTCFRFSHSAQYPLIATNNHGHRFHLLPLEDMQTAKDVRRFLYDVEVGTQTLLSFVKAQAPDHYPRIAERAKQKLDIYCSTSGGSYGIYHQRKIQLQLSYGYLHKLGHLLFPTVQQDMGYAVTWQYEGLCEYISYAIYPAYAMKRSYTYDVLHLYSSTGKAAGEGKSPNADNRALGSGHRNLSGERSFATQCGVIGCVFVHSRNG